LEGGIRLDPHTSNLKTNPPRLLPADFAYA
jgi:hypothetical protein